MIQKTYFKNSQGENLFGELFRAGMFERTLVLIIQESNRKKDEDFFEELSSNLKHNHIPYFRFYNFGDNTHGVQTDNIIHALNYLKSHDFDKFIIIAKGMGSSSGLMASSSVDGVLGMVLINPDVSNDFEQLKTIGGKYEGTAYGILSGSLDEEELNKSTELLENMKNSNYEVFGGADRDFTFMRDYRKMYRLVLEFVIENI